MFERYGADAATYNPYLGTDAAAPLLARGAVFAVCRTSNPGAGELQDLDVAGRPLYQRVAEMVVARWSQLGECGLVVGATFPAQLRSVREIVGDLPILVPGIGAQGGDVAASVAAGKTSDGTGMLLSSSREILYASSGDDFADAAANTRPGDDRGDQRSVSSDAGGDPQGGLEGGRVLGTEDDPIVRRDVDEVEVDTGLGDTAGEIGEHSRLVFDVDDNDVVLVTDGEVGQRQGVFGGLRVVHEDVHLGTLPVADAGRRGEVHPGVTDGCGHPGQGARLVVHLDHQILVHTAPFRRTGSSRPRPKPTAPRQAQSQWGRV